MWSDVYSFIRSKIKIIVILNVVLALFLGYFIGRINSSRDRIIGKLETSLKEGDIKSLSKVITVDDKKVSKEKLKPLMKYYNENSQAVDNVVKQLKNGEDTTAFYIKSKDEIFGKKYAIELKVYNVKVDSNFKEGKFTIDDRKYISTGECIENVIPGIYIISGKLKSDYGDIETSKEFLLMSDEAVKINFDAVNVTINSDFKDADLYINDKYTGIKVSDACDIGPFKNDGLSSAYIEKEFPWGIIKGKEEVITDIPVLNLSINMENDVLKKDIVNKANDFYESVFEALNKEEKSYISDAEESVKSKIYLILEKKYTFLKNKYAIDDVQIVEDKSEYTYKDDIYRANVIVQIDYSVEKTLFGLDKTKSSKKFFTKFIYDKDKEEWIVNDVENFSL